MFPSSQLPAILAAHACKLSRGIIFYSIIFKERIVLTRTLGNFLFNVVGRENFIEKGEIIFITFRKHLFARPVTVHFANEQLENRPT